MKLHLSFPIKLICLLLVCCFNFHTISYGQNYYIPNDAHLLALKQRNDLHFSGSTSTSFKSKNVSNFQLAYSPIKHIALSTNYFNYSHLDTKPSIQNETITKNWDIAIGGYLFFPLSESVDPEEDIEQKKKKNWKSKILWSIRFSV